MQVLRKYYPTKSGLLRGFLEIYQPCICKSSFSEFFFPGPANKVHVDLVLIFYQSPLLEIRL